MSKGARLRLVMRMRCWFRGYHCDSPTIGRFRYDVDGVCCYCGVVGTGMMQDDFDTPLGYATRLARCLWEKNYKADAPEWKPLPDLLGVLTQIDNMASGLIRSGEGG